MSIGPRRAALAAIFFVAACNDLSVRVSLQIPEDYGLDVRSLRLEILVPPVADPFTCDDVAFQRTPPATVALASIQEHTLGLREGVELSGIPRLGTKLFLVRGYDDQDLEVIAACGALDEIDGDETLALVAEPATVVIAPVPALGVEMPPQITIGVTNANNRPAEVEVRWDVTGAGGDPTDGSTSSDNRGIAVLQPAAPSAPGPAVLDVRARWGRDPPPRLAFFQPTARETIVSLPVVPDATTEPLGTRTRVVVGRVGPAGEMGIAAIGAAQAGGGRPIYVAHYAPEQDPPFEVATSELLLGVVTLGLARGANRDRIVSLVAGRWLEIHADASVSTALLPGVSGTARFLSAGGSCATDAADDVLLAAFIDESAPIAAFTPDGDTATSPFVANAPSGRLIATGCAADLGNDLRRVAVFNDGATRHTVLANLNGIRSSEWTTFPDSIGFAPPVGVDPGGLLGVRIAIDGTSIARYRLIALGGNELDLSIVAEDESTTPSISSAGGDVDGDDLLDVVAALDFGRNDEGGQYRAFMALGATAGGERLTAVSPLLPGEDPEVYVADFDEDGVDDVCLVTTDSLTLWLMGEP